MALKVFALAFVALLCVQGLNSHAINSYDDKGLFDIAQKVGKSIAHLREKIEHRAEELKQFLEDKNHGFEAHSNAIVLEKEAEINAQIAELNAQIKQIKDDAENMGIDIGACIAEVEDRIKNLPKLAIDELIKCATDKVQEVAGIVMEAVQVLVDFKYEIETLDDKLKACSDRSDTIQCIAQVVKDLIDATASVPIKLVAKYNEVVELINNLEADLKACAVSKVQKVINEGADILNDIVACIGGQVDKTML